MSLRTMARSLALAGCLGLISVQAHAEPGISPEQLQFEAWGNGRETGTTTGGTAAVGLQPWAPRVEKGFLGFNFDDNGAENDGFRFIPPDPIGAVSERRVLAVVNTMIESRNKGGKLKWRAGLADFFAPLEPKTFTFDPKIVYDQYEDRFVVVTLERVDCEAPPELPDKCFGTNADNESRILLAVSKNGNPKSSTDADWHYLSIDAWNL